MKENVLGSIMTFLRFRVDEKKITTTTIRGSRVSQNNNLSSMTLQSPLPWNTVFVLFFQTESFDSFVAENDEKREERRLDETEKKKQNNIH